MCVADDIGKTSNDGQAIMDVPLSPDSTESVCIAEDIQPDIQQQTHNHAKYLWFNLRASLYIAEVVWQNIW